MLQELFRIPGLDWPVYGYGLMMVLGFLLAMELAKFLARRSRLDPDAFVNAGLIALVSGVVGARLSHVLENLDQYTDPGRSAWANFVDAINISSGGLTFFGGLILATVCCIAYGLWRRVPLRIGMDIVAPCVMLGLAFGRVGCFLNGCCYGAECHLPWAVEFPYQSNAWVDQYRAGEIDPPDELIVTDADGGRHPISAKAAAKDPRLAALADAQHAHPVHPAQLYSAFNALLICAVLVAYYTLPHAPGRVFALMLILKGITRYLLEMLRSEPPVAHVFGYGLSFSMVVSIVLLAIGLLLWFVVFRRGDSTEWTAADAAPSAPPIPA
jgi:phosphatidylglycerol:prolipoprotein diacylglycerol transferase